MGPVGVVRTALWAGLLAGLAEVALLLVAKHGLGRYIHLPSHIGWMAPVSYVAIFLALAPLARLLTRHRPLPATTGLALSLFTALGVWGILQLATQLHPLARVLLALGVGVQAGRVAARRAEGFARLVRVTLPALAALFVLLGASVLGRKAMAERRALAALSSAPAGAPNILLIILDTVRSLDLSLYGYARATTPNLARFAARGTTFEWAISPAPWTLPAHASMFTGIEPAELSADWRTPLDRRQPTLAERLAARGYRTAGFVANTEYVSAESGLARGFAHYEDFRITPATVLLTGSALSRGVANAEPVRDIIGYHDVIGRKSAAQVNGDFLRWQQASAGRPFFAFLNYYDAHHPYLPPAPYDTLYAERGAARNPNLHNDRPVSRREAAAELDAYDGAIAYLDAQVGALLDSLDWRNVLGNTLVVITADHGEEFGEHGLLGHGNSLYLPALRVPLVIALPGRVTAGARVAAPVTTRDLAATILALAGGEARARLATLPGRSLLPFLPGDSAALRAGSSATDGTDGTGGIMSEVRHATGLPAWYPVSRGDMAALLVGRRHYIRDGDGREELYDAVGDPWEAHDLARVPMLRGVLDRMAASLRAATRGQ
ncbi:MAG: sulfatase [Gemmatimonadaceae bacterium]